MIENLVQDFKKADYMRKWDVGADQSRSNEPKMLDLDEIIDNKVTQSERFQQLLEMLEAYNRKVSDYLQYGFSWPKLSIDKYLHEKIYYRLRLLGGKPKKLQEKLLNHLSGWSKLNMHEPRNAYYSKQTQRQKQQAIKTAIHLQEQNSKNLLSSPTSTHFNNVSQTEHSEYFKVQTPFLFNSFLTDIQSQLPKEVALIKRKQRLYGTIFSGLPVDPKMKDSNLRRSMAILKSRLESWSKTKQLKEFNQTIKTHVDFNSSDGTIYKFCPSSFKGFKQSGSVKQIKLKRLDLLTSCRKRTVEFRCKTVQERRKEQFVMVSPSLMFNPLEWQSKGKARKRKRV